MQTQQLLLSHKEGATIGPFAGTNVVCTAEHATGRFSSYNSVEGLVITFTGCERGGVKCASAGGLAGEISTTPLEGALGVIKKSTTGPAADTIGIDLRPAGGAGPLAELSCAATAVTLRGSMIAKVTTNSAGASQAWKLSATAGKQSPSSFEGGPVDVPEASVNGGAYSHAGFSATLLWIPPAKSGSMVSSVN